jgi:sugar lactone lactonase YvrE
MFAVSFCMELWLNFGVLINFLFATYMKKNLFLLLFLLLPSFTINAAEPSIWTVNSRAGVLKGDARGVSIDQDGTITLAPKLTEVFKTEQPYIWSSVADAAGNLYLGTGGDGKIFRVDSGGKGTLFTDLNELNVSALTIGRTGELFAATSPDGKVYKIDTSGKADVFFEPKEKYIWSLAVMADGSLAVGTGDSGKIYRVRSAGAGRDASLFFDSGETHIISLATDKEGNLFAGTDSSGLVLRLSADGKAFALLDSPLREVHELAVGTDGSVYALVLGDSASAPAAGPATPATPSAPESKTVSADKPNPATPEPPQKSRYDLTGAKSAVYRILPDGGTDIIWSSASVSGFSLYARQTGSGVLIGTSDRGRIYSVTKDGRETMAMQTDANQISTIRSIGQKLFATSSNQGSLFQFGPETNAEGTYESSVLDAKSSATWGRIWWRSGGDVQIQTRSGNTERPDPTWSEWSSAYSDQKGAQISSPKAKYLQWRAVFRSSATLAILNEVSVSFIGRNIAPEVLSIQVLPTNVGLAANPPIQIDPNIELSGLDPITFGIPNASVPPRRIFQRGATSLQWTAEDRNGDKLVYDIYYKEIGETAFKLLRENLTDNFFTIDGQSFADGRYVFKIVAKDSPSNPAASALSGERLSDPVDIDNTPPVVTAIGSPQIVGDKTRIVFEAMDASSYLTRAEYSINGGDWQFVYADDGISDSPKERYTIDLPLKSPGEYSVTLRAYDVNSNSGNARVVVRK